MSNSVLEKEFLSSEARLVSEQERVRQEFITQLAHHMKQSGMMRKTLAEKTGRTPAHITKALQIEHNSTINTMVHMAMAAGGQDQSNSCLVCGEDGKSFGAFILAVVNEVIRCVVFSSLRSTH